MLIRKKALKKEIIDEIKKEIPGICRKLFFEILTRDPEKRLELDPESETTPVGIIQAANTMKRILLTEISKKLGDVFKYEAKNLIQGEEFIDTIIERIRKKQLS